MARKRKPPRTTCLECRKPLPELAIKNLDPYCSTQCARVHNGVIEREKLT